jgi:L-threonylcarbamoyladenylate synthase
MTRGDASRWDGAPGRGAGPRRTTPQAAALTRCVEAGGVAVFPADTVYGLACAPGDSAAVERLYALKGRPPDKPAAVMFFDRDLALDALPELEERTRALLERLLPGAVTALLPNPLRRFPLACGPDPHTLGLRVPDLPALDGMPLPVLQSSANHSGGHDARRLEDVPEAIRRDADLVLDGGELAGTPSTVVDLRRFELDGVWAVLRQGLVPELTIDRAAADLA